MTEMEKYYEKEFAILNCLHEKLDFSVFTEPVLCESNFFETMAWYIETLKDDDTLDENGMPLWKNWDVRCWALVDKILEFEDDKKRYWFIDRFFHPLKIDWLMTHGWEQNARIAKIGPKVLEIWESMFHLDDDKKIKAEIPGIVSPAIPQWYWTWFKESGLEAKVIGENRKNFVAAMRHGMEKGNRNEDEDEE